MPLSADLLLWLDTQEQRIATDAAAPLTQAVNNLNVQLAAANGTISAQQDTVTQLRAENTDLQARLDACMNPAPPDPTPLYGANHRDFAGLQTAMGGKLRVDRQYWGTASATIPADAQSAIDAGVIPWVSFDAIPDDAALRAHFAAWPSRAFWTFQHEVDHNKSDPATFKAACARIAAARDAAGAKGRVFLIPVLMANTYRIGAHAQWFGDSSTYDAVGVDGYRYWREPGSPPDPHTGNLSQSRSFEWIIGQAPAFAKSVGKPLAVGEFGAHPFTSDHANRPTWLKETGAYLKTIDVLAACYFHSGLGDSGPWWLDCFPNWTNPSDRSNPDPDSMEAYRSLLA